MPNNKIRPPFLWDSKLEKAAKKVGKIIQEENNQIENPKLNFKLLRKLAKEIREFTEKERQDISYL